ncbi:MAG TPA: porin [Bacteroidia bacterium]|nr:porin [Bacteroidia bacterium]HQK97007.1 porin [Bacteroidia bacterium]
MSSSVKKTACILTICLSCMLSFNLQAQVEDSTKTEVSSEDTTIQTTFELEPEDSTQQTIAKMYNDLDNMKRLTISGYVQAQWQIADSSGVGTYAGGNFNTGVDKRYSVRRGRLKFVYDKGYSKAVFQSDFTERGVRVVDAYARFTEQKFYWFSLQAGIFDRPFGYEIEYSSNTREAPERGRMSQILFPNERDMGAKIVIQGPKFGIWNWLKLDVALMTGNGSPDAGVGVSDFDKRKDLIMHLNATRSNLTETIKYGIGVSYYNGGVVYNADSLSKVVAFKMNTDKDGVQTFKADTVAPDAFAPRNYIGADAQFQTITPIGIFSLKAEYIQGEQAGTNSSTKSLSTKPSVSNPIYSRKFNGAYFTLVQNISILKSQLILKYDWYDPNTDIKGDEVGRKSAEGNKSTNATDLRYDTFGAGIAYLIDNNTKIVAYYDMVKNETSSNLSGYTKDLKDNVFTLRLQYKF